MSHLMQAGSMALAMLLAIGGTGRAAVPPEIAARLQSILTPVGAERAGNADGSIPAWTGGYSAVPPSYAPGAARADPFPGEKPLFSITAANVKDYAAKLPEGQKALFARFPDYRIDVYLSHRTAAAPESVYTSIFANATHARAAPKGIAYGVAGAVGGVPFPVPQNGFEVVWNHLLAFWGIAREDHMRTYFMTSDGTLELTNGYREIVDFPYY